ncbi:Hypothetical protein SMAX5B_004787, partial [Scophthalmus maximus]
CDNINTRREGILSSLVIYLNEDPDSFFKEYLGSAREDAESANLQVFAEDHNEFGWIQAECKDPAAENQVVCIR